MYMEIEIQVRSLEEFLHVLNNYYHRNIWIWSFVFCDVELSNDSFIILQ